MNILSRIRRTVVISTSWNSRRLPNVPVSSGHVVFREQSSFVPKHVLIVSKVSRYQFERIRESGLNDEDFKKRMLERGSDYQRMVESHERNRAVEQKLVDTLKNLNIQYQLKNRLTIEKFDFDWADLVMAIGGDGTFLLGSNLIFDNKKPIIGINSDPDMSEGYLMLQRRFTEDIPSIFEKLKAGAYDYLMRTRIRVTLKGDGIWGLPFHMHEKARICGQEIFCTSESSEKQMHNERQLPWLALNEVFIGESLSARTSSLEIKVDDKGDFHKVKSSGLCVSTGTGSSSWYKAINSLTTQMVRDIIRVAEPNKKFSDNEIEKICTEFNDSLQYSPDDMRMSYAIRDIILNDIWPLPKSISPRAFCETLTIRSQCYDAGLVFDGGIGIPFNVGTVALLETRPEDKLRTIRFLD